MKEREKELFIVGNAIIDSTRWLMMAKRKAN
jgi:hypothetical protein